MSTSNASTAVSAARFAMNPTPLGAAGLVGGALLGGKGGGGRNPLIPGYENGQYFLNGKPWKKANDYTIVGDNGTYDLMQSVFKGHNPFIFGPHHGGSKGLDADLNNQIIQQFNGDQKAINYYKNNFSSPSSFIGDKQKMPFNVPNGTLGVTRPPVLSIAQQEAAAAEREKNPLSKRFGSTNVFGSYGVMPGLSGLDTARAHSWNGFVLNKVADYAANRGAQPFYPFRTY